MLQLLPQTKILTPNTTNPQKAVEYINSYVDKSHCENLNVDISFFNIMDACYVSTMCSTNHYIKYPEGKIHWIIASKLTEELNRSLELGNADYSIYS